MPNFDPISLGNNIYGSEITRVLGEVKESTERTAYILMDKINPTPIRNYLLREDAPLTISNCLSELGVFGAYVRYIQFIVLSQIISFKEDKVSVILLCFKSVI